MNSRKLLIGCGIAVILGLGVVILVMIARFLIPSADQQLPPGTSSILININLPLNGAELPLNEPVSIYAEAVGGQPIHNLELWLDGAFSPTKMDTSPVDQSTISAVWLWTPAEEGVHRLIVRALGPGGEVVNSNVVRVSVLPRDKIADLQVTDIPSELLPPNETPAADAANQPSGGPTVAPPPPPFPPQDPPQLPAEPSVGAPSLQGSINQCDVTLLIQDNAKDEMGFYLYRFDPTSTGFTRVATLDKHPGQEAFTYLDAGLSLGNHTYYIASFNGSGESASNLINLKVTTAQCAATGPQAIGLQDAILNTSKAVDKVYCYLSVDQGPWSRIPPGSNKFIYPTAGGFDFSKYLNALITPPPPGGVTLELECWGWSGNTLVYLGYLKQDINKGPVQLIGTDFNLIGKLGISGPETFPFKLSPDIAPPYSVTMVNDLGKCTSILSELFGPSTAAGECKDFIDYGWTILSWKWDPGCPFIKVGETCPYTVKDIDGYRFYRVFPGNEPVQISYTANGSKFPWGYIAPTTGGMIQPQYFVRAYKGIEESADSIWVTGLSPKYTVILKNPKLWLGRINRNQFDGFACPDGHGPIYTEYSPGESHFWVGYDYHASEITNTCTDWYSTYFDGHVVFDLSSIKGQVTGAILRWKWKGSFAKGDGVKNGLSKACWIPLTDQNGAIIHNYPLNGEGGGYDVTTQVRAWVQGIPNKGFALLSGNRSLAWAENEMCEEKFGSFELDVTYTK